MDPTGWAAGQVAWLAPLTAKQGLGRMMAARPATVQYEYGNMVDFPFIVSLYVSDLPNVTISTVLVRVPTRRVLYLVRRGPLNLVYLDSTVRCAYGTRTSNFLAPRADHCHSVAGRARWC